MSQSCFSVRSPAPGLVSNRHAACVSASATAALRVRPGCGSLQQAYSPSRVHGAPTQHTQARLSRGAALVTRATVSDTQYDYIIVGGGTAGCLLANRLSADPSKKVLVLEAGGENKDFVVKAPAGLTRLFNHPVFNWNLDSTKQAEIAQRELYLSRGKLLGGSSCVNATLYHRGTAQDYDSWGLPGWTSKEVLPWFVMSEDNPSMAGSEYHSTGGGMHVEKPIYQNALFNNHFEASNQAGIPHNPDFNDWSRSQEGYGDFQVSITARGRRADAYRQFLAPVEGRNNLTVVTSAQTTKVHIDKVNGVTTALGVDFQRLDVDRAFGPVETVRLTTGGEVIMAAGTVHTPQILMLSGVGDAAELKEQGIKCHSDLPGVGKNLQDHPCVLTAFSIKDSAPVKCSTDDVYNSSGDISKRAIANFILFGKGPLTSTGCDRGAFVKTTPEKSQPDLQLRFVAAMALNPDAIKSYTEFGRLKQLGVSKWPRGITFQVLGCRPKSRGTVSLNSASITHSPLVDLAYCSDVAGADRATLKEGIRITRRIAQQKAWQGVLEDEVHPGTNVDSDDALDEYLNNTMHSGNALTGTCAMGVDPSKGAVVSSADLCVHGVASLRVIDASVLPIIPGGQTGAPVVMIAERAAAMMTQRQPAIVAARLAVPALV